jgi:hypothetical protein
VSITLAAMTPTFTPTLVLRWKGGVIGKLTVPVGRQRPTIAPMRPG